MDVTIYRNWNKPPVNAEPTKENKYMFLCRNNEDGVIAYFDAETMEPLCYIPDKNTGWAAIYYVALTVHRLFEERQAPKVIRKETEALARSYRSAHLRDRAYIKTIKRQLRIAMKLEPVGENTWATDYGVFEWKGRRIMARLLPHPGKAG